MILIASKKVTGFPLESPYVKIVRSGVAFREAITSQFFSIDCYIIEDDLGSLEERGSSLYDWLLTYAEDNQFSLDNKYIRVIFY